MYPIEERRMKGHGLSRLAAIVFTLVLALVLNVQAQSQGKAKEVLKRLQSFDAYMTKILADWNAPGIGVGVVADGQLVFAKGYGYRGIPFKP
jgi:CubicO group peptidase (beta-lactamase class C family)